MSTKQSAGGHPHDHVVEGLGITPLKGHLVPLKTKGEIRASNELIDVYVVELPARSANAVLSILRSALPADTTTPAVDIQHLRRVIKPSFLPPPALGLLTPNRVNAPASFGETRFLLVCPTTQIAPSDLSTLLSAHPPFKPTEPAADNDDDSTAPAESVTTPSSFPLAIHTLPVPALAPTSAPQADGWTATYWPVAYKHTNPYGPHPSLVSRAAAEVSPRAGTWLALAECGAWQAVDAGMTAAGAAVGAVVVERRLDGNGRAVQEGRCVVVAGDARRCGMVGGDDDDAGAGESEGCGGVGAGNVMAHAVMRAIGMVALKRLRLEEAAGKSSTQAGDSEGQGEEKEQKPSRACCDPVEPVFAVQPRTEVEKALFERDDNLSPNGYLCVDLEIYLTHEPCVMCSMAILHSRFNRVVFNRRMPRSGGMTADEHGVGHGLFWRPAELNWKFLCWEFVEDNEGAKDEDEESKLIVDDGINA
ncbi:tRNA-specific adenosine-34 deaminase subunit tad3 [Lasiodiplodia theobromae]|uniref:tRNA-specific adenosine-34 deaminase subunit tad3 n=1 Tax=Lasiodiplodia theobromae TaxID=45133 RepID=UPI0015C35812|nr:tRNA-specific adenosine-34 deaminase subunit tad3 [Lasiodiplodia theobromae]KAF4544620.1 tRNA-specific adenosine-34 deaminase subunit tad3 [Lasiodiplodia theobromae]